MRTRNAQKQHGSAADRCGRLLLFAALVLGIALMHTLGHPSGGGEAHHTAATQHTPAAAQHTSVEQDGTPRDPQLAPAAHLSAPGTHDEDGGTDPLSVCLAVLGALAAAGLLGAALARGRAPRLPAAACLVTPGRAPPPPPEPPPHAIRLAQLSVLRA
ncbi:DUF6153 family protein [Streptomyces sulphureus]|uniref:DUF6153 family protein n=1 Tax=Streptomyces sulphureus TaxID=47758 RepID=UPI00037C0B02|nr:DUF6153 family protein [Streptomyces sulphureus]